MTEEQKRLVLWLLQEYSADDIREAMQIVYKRKMADINEKRWLKKRGE